jgi:SRSO17 transposase
MADRMLDWRDELGHWLKPFLARLGHKARRQMCPLYVSGLIGPGDRKSIEPMARRLALGACDQLHHFIAAGVWVLGLWRQNCWFKQISSWVAAMPCW